MPKMRDTQYPLGGSGWRAALQPKVKALQAQIAPLYCSWLNLT
jgi:hypothetical protein